MPNMGYPILLNLQDKQVIVVGGGAVATRKVRRLLESEARVLVISPDISPTLQTWVDAKQIEWVEAVYQRDMLNTYMPLLVIATTDNARVNQTVAQDAHRIRAWVNIVDGNSDESDFSNMAIIDRPPITIALSTNGASPALVGHIKAHINEVIGDEYAILAQWLGDIRPTITSELDGQSNRLDLYQEILESNILALLRQSRQDEAQQAFRKIIAERTPQ